VEQFGDLDVWYWPGKIEALGSFAAEVAKQLDLLWRFDAFSYDAKADDLRERDNG
jgi:hypothetical protein